MTDTADGQETVGEETFEEAFKKLWPESRMALIDQEIRGDILLTRLVEMANDSIGISVTLSVGGRLITGTMASIQQYFDCLIEDLGAVEPEEIRQALQKWFDNERPAREKTVLADGLLPRYIHLINARYVSESGWIPAIGSKPLTWRGKIACVDGFTIGSFSPGK